MKADDELLCCQVCGERVAELRFPCRCATIFFCSEAHRAAFVGSPSSSPSLHSAADCARFAGQLRGGARQLDSLLESIVETPAPRDACSILKEAGVHGGGLFASCCPCGSGSGSSWPALPGETTGEPAALPSLESLLRLQQRNLRPLTPPSPPSGWSEYLAARGLLSPSSSPSRSSSPSSSPAAAAAKAAAAAAAALAAMTLLHRPLTASLALDAAGWWSVRGGGQEKEAGGRKRRGKGDDDGDGDDDENDSENEIPRPFVLHVVGASADAEVAQWPCWLELAALGGGGGREERKKRSLAVTLVGPTVPASLSGASAAFSSSSSSEGFSSAITINFARGRYHDVLESLLEEEPDAVFAPDAGIAADFDGWRETVLSWTTTRPPRGRNRFSCPRPHLPPVLVTDLTEEAALLSAAAVRKVLSQIDADDDDAAGEEKQEGGGGGGGGGGETMRRRFRVTDPELNPFRCPARVRAPGGTALPAAAGGWAFWILEEAEGEDD